MIPGSANTLLLTSAAAAGGYQVSRSLRFNSADSAYLSRTPGSAGNRKTFTWAGWVKRSKGGARQGLFGAVPTTNSYTILEFDATDGLTFYDSATGGVSRQTSAVYRDYSAWMHVVLAVDTTAATAANRVKLYVNGSEVTVFASSANPAQNTDTQVNVSQQHVIGSELPAAGNYLDGYLADIHFIDGQALTPTSFGEFDTNGVWQPKAYSGSFGTNGFWLKFSDNSAATATTLGKDYSGNSNNWTPNNLSVTAGAGNDSLVDTPTSYGTDTGAGGEVRGNYCTLNAVDRSSSITPTNGNLTASDGTNVLVRGTIFVSSGKWYYECTATTVSGAFVIGVATNQASLSYLGVDAFGWGYTGAGGGLKYNAGGSVGYGSGISSGDVIGVAIDMDAKTLVFYKNNTSLGIAFSNLAGAVAPAFSGGSGSTCDLNFGQRPFAYTAPSGFKALCTANLPAPTIAQGSTAMDVKLYTGNGSTQTISGLGFSPDLVWIKKRSAAGHGPWYDSVRGIGKAITSSLTNSEYTAGSTQELTAFNSDGFSLGTDYNFDVNTSSQTFVGWCWDAGTSNATNTSGTITSTVRANISAGLSIITFTAPSSNQNFTVGHGLGIAPAFTILKRRDSSTGGDWWTWHIGLGDNTTDYLALNQTSAENSLTAMWGATGRTSSLLGFSTPNSIVASGTYVVYAFAPVAGYSAFGSYTGNGSSTDGPFQWCGFRPRFLLIKGSSVANTDWAIIDTARDTYNIATDYLAANSSGAEQTLNLLDVVSNGFKIKAYTDSTNQNNQTYVWAAFAEHPFALARAR